MRILVGAVYGTGLSLTTIIATNTALAFSIAALIRTGNPRFFQ
jgi:hypothetical protein